MHWQFVSSAPIDRGVNFMDNSWDYNDGNGEVEIRMGKTLRDGYRLFLMTKVDGRTTESAARQVDQSLHASRPALSIDCSFTK
jgi:predicted aldo/keto reductase-like oxidoreductase